MPKLVLPLLLALLFLPLMACASSSTVRSPDGERHEMRGQASWYGEPFHGRQTASGETFNMNAHTAAHKTLPFGTMVRVRTTEDRRTVVVRITDRGPFTRGRVIDLSYAAARDLGMIQAGVVDVELEVINW